MTDRLRDAARGGFRALLLSSGLLAVYGVEYAAGWIPTLAFIAVAWLLLAIAVVAVAVAVPWLASTTVNAYPRLRILFSRGGDLSAAAGRVGRSVDAADVALSALPGDPPSSDIRRTLKQLASFTCVHEGENGVPCWAFRARESWCLPCLALIALDPLVAPYCQYPTSSLPTSVSLGSEAARPDVSHDDAVASGRASQTPGAQCRSKPHG